jgi:hypothetical protein
LVEPFFARDREIYVVVGIRTVATLMRRLKWNGGNLMNEWEGTTEALITIECSESFLDGVGLELVLLIMCEAPKISGRLAVPALKI